MILSKISILLAGLLLLIGCGESKKPNPSQNAGEISSLNETKAEADRFEDLTEIIKLDNGQIVGVSHQWSQNFPNLTDNRIRAAWGYRLLDQNSMQLGEYTSARKDSLWIPDRSSNLVRVSPYRYQFYVEDRKQDVTGQIISTLRQCLYNFQTQDFECFSEIDFEWGQFAIENPGGHILDPESTLDLRNSIREIYEYLLQPSRVELPVLGQGLVVVGDPYETIALIPESKKTISLRMLTTNLDRSSSVAFCKNFDTKGNFAIQMVEQTHSNKLEIEILELDAQSASSKTVIEHSLTAPSSLSVDACQNRRDSILITGSIRPQENDYWHVWVARYKKDSPSDFKALEFEILEASSNTTSNVIDYWPSQDLIVIGGKTNFSQAKTGSIGYADGIIYFLSSDLKYAAHRVVKGSRSTVITALRSEQDALYAGGITNAPSTHSSNRSSSVFIEKIKKNEINNNIMRGE